MNNGGIDAFIFLHIEKTAGRSLNAALADAFPEARTLQLYPYPLGDNAFDATLKMARGIELVVGHVDFGIHEKISLGRCRYFTFVRQPVDRLISEFFYFKRRNSELPRDQWRKKNQIIDDCASPLDFLHHPERIANPAASRICGKMFGHEVSLERAKDNIMSDFAFVGVLERLQLSIAVMSKELGRSLPTIPVLNKGSGRAIAPHKRNFLEAELTTTDRIDFLLYDWCLSRLTENEPHLSDQLNYQSQDNS